MHIQSGNIWNMIRLTSYNLATFLDGRIGPNELEISHHQMVKGFSSFGEKSSLCC
jgi:hypothetical protein